jgi:hypothetical protein
LSLVFRIGQLKIFLFCFRMYWRYADKLAHFFDYLLPQA